MAKKEILNNDAVTIRVGEAAVNAVEGTVETVESIMAETADVIEKTLDVMENQVERVVTVTRNNPLVLAGVLLLGLAAGGYAGYKFAERKLTTAFEIELEEQIQAAKSFHKRLAKEDFPTPEAAVEALVPDEVVEAVSSYKNRATTRVPYNKIEEVVAPEVVVKETIQVTQNIFRDAPPDPRDWDYNAEIADRELNPDVPFAISFEEFDQNEVNHEQATLTFYAFDQTLADAQDKIVDNVEYTIAEDNLLRFGHGSQDPKIVYIRNEKLGMDFEVIRSEGSYKSEVMGLDDEVATELSHSRTRRPNRRHWRTDE